uniref:Uncharacterized protein n=1 Tax=Timema monikensis TaxID=170555 RepID=A0A7R9HRJ7_9NEOP|nr:unnamed protein product [Timema monikensis]
MGSLGCLKLEGKTYLPTLVATCSNELPSQYSRLPMTGRSRIESRSGELRVVFPKNGFPPSFRQIGTSGHVEDVTIWNLSTYQVKHFTIVWENSAVQFNLFFPELFLKGHYDINGSFGNAIYAYGKGPFTVRLIGLEVSGLTTACFQDKALFLESLVLDFTIQRYEGNLENMMGDEKLSQLINRMLNDSLVDVLNYFKPDISKVMSKKVLDFGNGYLKEMSFSQDDILSWLPGGTHVRNTWNTLVG